VSEVLNGSHSRESVDVQLVAEGLDVVLHKFVLNVDGIEVQVCYVISDYNKRLGLHDCDFADAFGPLWQLLIHDKSALVNDMEHCVACDR